MAFSYVYGTSSYTLLCNGFLSVTNTMVQMVKHIEHIVHKSLSLMFEQGMKDLGEIALERVPPLTHVPNILCVLN